MWDKFNSAKRYVSPGLLIFLGWVFFPYFCLQRCQQCFLIFGTTTSINSFRTRNVASVSVVQQIVFIQKKFRYVIGCPYERR